MTNIYKIRLLGLVTLLLFPIPGFFLLDFFQETSWTEFFFELKKIDPISIGYGLEFGFAYALMAYLFMKADALERKGDTANAIAGFSDSIAVKGARATRSTLAVAG